VLQRFLSRHRLLKEEFFFLDLPQEALYGEGGIKHLWSVISLREMSKHVRAYDGSK
jgi:hypothetical protein